MLSLRPVLSHHRARAAPAHHWRIPLTIPEEASREI